MVVPQLQRNTKKQKRGCKRMKKINQIKNVGADDPVCPRNRGITLIALIITIIVLLILAMVSIRLVMNGEIIKHAETSTSKYAIEEEKEKVQLSVTDSRMAANGGAVTNTNLQNALKNQFGEDGYENWHEYIDEKGLYFEFSIRNGTGIIYKVYTDAFIESGEIGKWHLNEENIITDGKVKVQIGDYVKYDPTKDDNGNDVKTQSYISYSLLNSSPDKNDGRSSGYSADQEFTVDATTNGWRVLGIENGRIQLISEDPIKTKNNVNYFLGGEKGYLSVIRELNAICSIYGFGKGALTSRSLNVDDINKLANFNPETFEGYKDLYEYRFPENGQYMQSRKSTDQGKSWSQWTDITKDIYQIFRLPGTEETISSNNRNDNGIRLESTWYNYTISSDNIKNEKILDMLIKNEIQFLASRNIYCVNSGASFDIRLLSNEGFVGSAICYISGKEGNRGYGCGVRPIVILENDVLLKGNSEEGWTIENIQ